MSFTASLDEIVAENSSGLLGKHESWERVRLTEIATIQNGAPFPSNLFSKGEGFPLLRIRDILTKGTEATYTGEVDSQFIVEPGDLVVGMDGDFNAALWRGPRALLNQRVCRITPKEIYFSRRFLAYVLPGYLSAINQKTSAITVKHLSSKTIGDIPLPLLPRQEQERLVAELERYFSRLEASVASLRRVQANLKYYQAAVLKAACEGRLVPKEAELARAEGRGYETASELLKKQGIEEVHQKYSLPPLPQGWTWSYLGSHIHQIEAGKNFKCEERPPQSGEVGVVKVSAVTWGTFNEQETKTCTDSSQIKPEILIKKDDFLFSRANTLQLVGACVIVDHITKDLMLSDKILRFKINDLRPKWVLYTLRSSWGRSEIERLATGNQESMRNIGQDRIRSIRIPLPPVAEGDRIILEIERQLSIVSDVEREIAVNLERAKHLRQVILQKAFEGRLVPQDPNDEPASVLLERIRQTRASQSSEPRTRKAKPKPELAPLPLVRPEEPPPAIEPEPEPQEANFLELPRQEQLDILWQALLGKGGLDKDVAIRTAADELRALDLARFKRLRQDGPLYGAIAASIERGVREGSFDRPRRGAVRAVLPDPKEYTDEVWQQCLLAVTGPEPADIEATLRAAAEWARETMGLEFERLRGDGVILTGLREALKEEVRAGRIVRRDGRVWRG